MTDYVWDEGKAVAYIKDQQVIRGRDEKRIGFVRAQSVYDLEENLVGHLTSYDFRAGYAGYNVAGWRTKETSAAFKRLIDE